MVLKLREQLIKHAAIQLPRLPGDLCKLLTADQRERILRWIASHDRLSPDLVPTIASHLLSVPLHYLEFYKCSQLTNDMLIEFAQASPLRRLKSLIIHQCSQVKGTTAATRNASDPCVTLDSGLQAITKGQTLLEFVGLRKLNGITDKGLDELHSAFLKEIDLRWNEHIHDQGTNHTVDLRN